MKLVSVISLTIQHLILGLINISVNDIIFFRRPVCKIISLTLGCIKMLSDAQVFNKPLYIGTVEPYNEISDIKCMKIKIFKKIAHRERMNFRK
jgi:hypothetical protein